MKKVFGILSTWMITIHIVAIVFSLYVLAIKNNNGKIDLQPDTSEFISKVGVSEYLVFSFWTCSNETNVVPGSDDYSTSSDTYASCIVLILLFSWFILLGLLYNYNFKKNFYRLGLLGLILVYQLWFIVYTIKTMPLIF